MGILLFAMGNNFVSDEQTADIKQHVPNGLTFVQTNDKEAIADLAAEIEVVAGWFSPKQLVDMPNLKWAQQWWSGANWLANFPEVQKRPFTLTNVAGIHAIQISEHIFGMLLHFGRNLPNAIAAQNEKTWAAVKHPSESFSDVPFAFSTNNIFELAEKTMLIVGVGAIGERTAKLAKAFDMHVIGIRYNPEKPSPFVDQMVSLHQLLDVIPLADLVVLTAPFTSETYHIINKKALAAMKSTAYLINIGRGELVDESALLPALQSRTIAGAGLDVFEQEPLPQDSLFWELDNLLITSHYAGATPHYHERATAVFTDNLKRYAANQPLLNVVDKMKGY